MSIEKVESSPLSPSPTNSQPVGCGVSSAPPPGPPRGFLTGPLAFPGRCILQGSRWAPCAPTLHTLPSQVLGSQLNRVPLSSPRPFWIWVLLPSHVLPPFLPSLLCSRQTSSFPCPQTYDASCPPGLPTGWCLPRTLLSTPAHPKAPGSEEVLFL